MKNPISVEAKIVIAVAFTFLLVAPAFWGIVLLAFWGVGSLPWLLMACIVTVALVILSWSAMSEITNSSVFVILDVFLGVVLFSALIASEFSSDAVTTLYIACLIAIVAHSMAALFSGLGLINDESVEVVAVAAG